VRERKRKGLASMHEYAIAQALVEQIEKVARENNAGTVRRVVVQIGKLRGVVPEVLRWGFEVAAHDSLAAGVAVEIEEIPIRIRCSACSAESSLDEPLFLCPVCGSCNVEQLAGSELILKSLEICHE